MRILGPFICYLLLQSVAVAQPVKQQTQGDQSPAVVAEDIRITYGVPPNITLEIIRVYERQGTSSAERNAAVKALIKKYKSLGDQQEQLSKPQQTRLGLKPGSPLVSLLNYDLFLSTKGNQSPAIYAPGGHAEIWYGIPPEAFRGIWKILEDKQLALEDFDKKLQEQIEKFKELEKELGTRVDYDQIAVAAKKLLDQGDIEGAERILEQDVLRQNKQTAYRNYEVARIKDLNGKLREAGEYYMLAALLEKENSNYSYAYGRHLLNLGHYEAAAEQLQNALEHLSEDSSQGEAAARRYNQLGELARELGRYDEAINYYNRALNITLGLSDIDAGGTADTYNHLGLAYVAKGEINQGIDYYHQALKIYQEKPAFSFPQIAITYNNMGSAYAYKQDFPQALEYYEFALKVLQEIYGEEHPRTATSLNNIGFVYGQMQDLNRAMENFQKALDILRRTYGEEHPNFARTYSNLGVVYAYRAEFDQALAYYQKVLDIDRRIFKEGHPDIADDHTNIGNAYLSKKEFEQSITNFREALTIDLRFHGPYHQRVARDYGNLGAAYMAQRAYDQAIEQYQHVVEVYENISGGNPMKLITAFNNIGAAYAQKKDFPRAIEALEKAKLVVRQVLPVGHPYLQKFDRDIRYLKDQIK